MIARTRKRPREKSITWRTFGWLIRREAMAAIWTNVYGHERHHEVREAVLRHHPINCLACTRSRIENHPAERFWP